MRALYQKTVVIKRLKEYFSPYLSLLTKPSGDKLFLLLLAMIAMQLTTSIKYLYKWFLCDICGRSLNTYYYLLNETEISMESFYKITLKLALSLIPEKLRGLPVFLLVDDTLQAKYGTHFECYQKMFDHAQHNGSNYLNGHCFVALAVAVPVLVDKEIRYLRIPIGFRLRKEKENKLQIAEAMVKTAMEVLAEYPMVILLCDSWYPKGVVNETVKQYSNLELIANVRIDTNLFDLPPPRTGKRGRPSEKGKALDIYTDFHFIKVEDYFIATRTVMTNLFGKLPVHLTITTPDVLNHKAYRIFISTVLPEKLTQQFKGYEKTLSNSIYSQISWLLPLNLYSLRWGIEVIFYEQKKFWSFGLYRLRSKVGIERFVNFSSLCYACMQMLPIMDTRFAALQNESPQTVKYFIGEAIRREIFLCRFASKSEKGINSLFSFEDLLSFDNHSGFFRVS